jgi:hypothetical protein
LINKYSQAFGAYKELLQTGGIQSTVEGEKVFIDIRGNVSGDILVFIIPKDKIAIDREDIMNMISSDNNLNQLRSAAFESLRQKFEGITILPERLVWLVNICILLFYAYWKFDTILALFSGEVSVAGIFSLSPLLILTVITPFLSKYFGFNLLKPILSVIIRLVKIIRLIRNRKIGDSQG